MTTILQDAPEVLAAFEEYNRFKIAPAMREKVRARQRFLDDERLKLTGARDEKAREVAVNMKQEGCEPTFIAKMTGLSLPEIERLT